MTQNNIDVQKEKIINYALQYGTSIEHAMQETHTSISDICKTYDIYYDILSERIEKVCNEIVEQKKSKKNTSGRYKRKPEMEEHNEKEKIFSSWSYICTGSNPDDRVRQV